MQQRARARSHAQREAHRDHQEDGEFILDPAHPENGHGGVPSFVAKPL
jgi:hypothetical protein